MSSNFHPSDYDDLLSSAQWNENLRDLNQYVAHSLAQVGEPPALNGNLFYEHRATGFQTQPFIERFEPKRRNFFELARRSTRLFEIGVNAGHSMLLALMANPEIKCVGVDVCQRLNRRWARVDIYVPAAFNWLRYKFPDRVELIKGNSLIEAPAYALRHPDAKIDFLHLDGAKDTHLREVLALHALMPSGAFIVHDDSNLRPVRIADRQLRRLNFSKPIDYSEFGLTDCEFHLVRAAT